MTIQANFPAIKPSLMLDFANTKQLDSRITYTRASTASYYDGVTTSKAEQNLATYSQQFDNAAWLKENSSITADSTTAPDGTTTADSLVESSATGPHGTYTALLSVTTASTVTVSIYAKQNTKRYIVLGSTDGFANYPVLFDLQSGVVVGNATGYPAYSAPTSSTITSVGSSWYRLTVTVTINGAASSARIIAYLTDDSGSVSTGFSYTGNGTSSAYIWGAQLEQRSAVSAYTATTTQAITNYIPKLQSAASGVARFDNNPTTGESLGLLIEQSRTNLVTYSSDLSNAAWTKSNSTITADTIIAPDGALSGDKLVETTANGVHSASVNSTVTNGTTYTFSAYVKAAERGWCVVQLQSAVFAYVNLTTGAVGTTVGSPVVTVTSVGNGWYRIAVTAAATSTSINSVIYTSTGDTTVSYTGDGYSGIYIWGAQLETGGFSTSYVPTVASQVTRAADAASMTGTNFSTWYNAGSGTLYGEGIGASSSCAIATINTGTSFSNMIVLGSINSTNEAVRIYANGSAQAELGTISINTNFKVSLAYATNNIAASLNGATALTDASAIIPIVGMDTLQIGRQWNSTQQICGTIKKIAYYPIRVSNTNLQALTS